MDTLCIPAASNLKSQTIHNMASIYALAHCVLVLDRELMALADVSVAGQHFMHILCSTWMHRSWTLQEGLLNQRYIFQFLDKALVVEQALLGEHEPSAYKMWKEKDRQVHKERICDANIWRNGDSRALIRRDLSRYFLKEFLSLNKTSDYKVRRPEADQFISIWNAMATRSTSKSEDLYLIFANLLNLRTEDFSKQSTSQEKFQRILFSFASLPTSLLFIGRRTNSQEVLFQDAWIPNEIGREILTGYSRMQFDQKDKVFRLCDIHGDCDVYTVSSANVVFEKNVARFEGVDGLYSIEHLFERAVGNDLTSNKACLVIQKHTPNSENYRRGACFLVTGISRDALRQSYCFSIRVRKEDEGGARPELTSTFRAFKVAKGCKILIQYGTTVIEDAS